MTIADDDDAKLHVVLCLSFLFFYFQLFSIIVFSCVAARGTSFATGKCMYGGDANACGYGIGIGVIAFLLCIAFLVLEAMFEQISGVQHRKYAVMADIAVSGRLIVSTR